MRRVASLPFCGVCAVLASAALAWPAAAQVLAIGDDGAVATYSGPAVYSSDGVRSLTPQPPAGPARAAPQAVSRPSSPSVQHTAAERALYPTFAP